MYLQRFPVFLKSLAILYFLLFGNNLCFVKGQEITPNGGFENDRLPQGGPFKIVSVPIDEEKLMLDQSGAEVDETKTRSEADGVYFFFDNRFIRVGHIASFHPYYSKRKAENFNWLTQDVARYFKGGVGAHEGKPDKEGRIGSTELQLPFKQVEKSVSEWAEKYEWVQQDPYVVGRFQLGQYLMLEEDYFADRASTIAIKEYWDNVAISTGAYCADKALNGVRFLSDNLIIVGQISFEETEDSLEPSKKIILQPQYAVAFYISSESEYEHIDTKKGLVYRDSLYKSSTIYLYKRKRESMKLKLEISKLNTLAINCPIDPDQSIYRALAINQGGLAKSLTEIAPFNGEVCEESNGVVEIEGFPRVQLDPTGKDGGASARQLMQILDRIHSNKAYPISESSYSMQHCEW